MAVIDKDDFFDHSFWLEISKKLLEPMTDLDGAEYLVDRFVRQYLSVLLRARSKADFDRVWLAFWNYLVAPRTRRKPLGLSSRAADLLIAEFQSALSELG